MQQLRLLIFAMNLRKVFSFDVDVLPFADPVAFGPVARALSAQLRHQMRMFEMQRRIDPVL